MGPPASRNAAMTVEVACSSGMQPVRKSTARRRDLFNAQRVEKGFLMIWENDESRDIGTPGSWYNHGKFS